MRTQEEIIERMNKSESFLGFDREVLVTYLDFEHAKGFLKEEFAEKETAPEEWEKARDPMKREHIIEEMKKYMEFAWGKAEDHRGISAGRSVDKMEAWLWLLGDEVTLKAVEQVAFENYGCPKLAVICERYGFPIPESKAIQNMIKGERCGADYECGCGK